MLWSSLRLRGRLGKNRGLLPVLMTSSIIATILLTLSAAGDPPGSGKSLSIYSIIANYSLPVSERNGQDYVGLLEVLDPLGKVSAKTDGKRWKIHYNDNDAEFVDGKKSVRLPRTAFDLPANFLLENGHGMVPLSSLPQLLSRILGGPITFHENSRRVFVGNVGIHFTAQVNRASTPALVLNFTAPVNPTIATESGKLHMHFEREPLMAPGSPVLTFDSKIIPSASFEESNGAAEITINGGAPLFAAFSEDRKTITVTAAQQNTAQTQAKSTSTSVPVSVAGPSGSTASSGASPVASPNEVASGTPPNPATPGQRRYFAIVDASHGGDDRGAALSDQLAEKDVTLAFAQQLRQQLENRGITTLLLRAGDTTLTLDQRAGQTNSIHPAIYLCVHATSQGTGVRIYTSLIPAGGESRGPFIAWETAQAAYVSISQIIANSVTTELRNKEILVRTLAAPLRPLNNVTVPAIALEIAPAGGKGAELFSPDYQQMIFSTVAAGIAAARPALEAAP
jgi:N-acetylmuramoyl-L-alanine amidase